MSSSTFRRWQTERKSDLPKVTQQVSREAREGIQAFCIQTPGFPTAKAPFHSRGVTAALTQGCSPEFCTEAYVLQKRNTKLSSVSPHLKGLWQSLFPYLPSKVKRGERQCNYLSFNSGNEPLGLTMGVVGGAAHQNRMRNFFNIHFSLRSDSDEWAKPTA